MKNKLKKLILCIALAVTVSIGSFCGLLTGVLNFQSFAEYKPTSVTSDSKPYEFDSSTGWEAVYFNNNDFKSAFNSSSFNFAINSFDDENKPTKNYKGEDLTENDNVLAMIAKDAPVSVLADKKDDDGKYVYEMDGDKYKYVKDETNSDEDKVFTETWIDENDSSNKEDYVQEGDTDVWHKRIRVQESQKTYYYYKTSSTLSKLSENSYYVVTAFVYTHNAVASISLADSSDDVSGTFKEISSEDAWKQVWLFFETSESSSLNAYLKLYYGSKDSIVKSSSAETTTSGFVLFDCVDVQKISLTEFNNKTVDGKTATEENADVSTDSVRKNYSFDSSNLDPTFSSDLVINPNKFGDDNYVKSEADQQYQYYVPKYSESSTTTLLGETELKNYHNAYSKLSQSVVSEYDSIKTTIEAEDDDEEDTIVQFNSFRENNKVLKLENTSESYNLGVLSPVFTIKQFATYRFSIWTKSTNVNDSAIVKLISYVKTGDNSEGALQIVSQEVTAFTKSNDITNNWTEVVFYVQSNPLHDCEIQVALLAGKSSTIYFDEMRLEAVTTSVFENASSSKKLDLGKDGNSSSSDTYLIEKNTIKNGGFNEISTSKTDLIENIEKPYAPADWTKLDDNDKDVVSGIISSKADFWSNIKEKIGGDSIVNPINVPILVNGQNVSLYDSNLLVIYAEEEKSFGYKSSKFSLSSNSVYEITFWTFAEKSNFEGEIYVNLIYSDTSKTVAEFKQDLNKGNGGEWVKHTIIVKTDTSSRDFTLEIGTTEASGTVYFRRFSALQLEKVSSGSNTQTVDEQYAELLKNFKTFDSQSSNNTKFVDLSGNSSLMYSNDKVEGKDYYNSLYYEKETVKDEDNIVQGELGVVDTNASLNLDPSADPSLVLESSFLKRENATSDLALLIYNSGLAQTTIKPIKTNSLSSSSYYRISFWVKTANIEETKGLTAKMSAISAEFTNINTGALDDAENQYTLFTVLVKTGSSTISNFEIDFILGSENNTFSGIALISDIEIFKFSSESDFNKALEEVDENDKNTIVKDFSSSSKSDDKNDETADNLTLATFFLVFSSILLVVALVIAIIAISIKKLPKSKTVVGTNNANVSIDKNNDSASKDGFV